MPNEPRIPAATLPPRPTTRPVGGCVFLFPGQSSVDPGMVRRARELGQDAESVLDRVGEVLGGEALAALGSSGGVRLASNRDIQLAVFVVTQMHAAVLHGAGVRAAWSAGLSLGEYSHLVHIGALSFEEALSLVSARGEAYDASPDGVMVAVLGATRDEVAAAVAEGARQGTVVISNYNTDTQHLISGERDAVARTVALLEEGTAAGCVETERRVPMHSPVMAPVAARFRAVLQGAPWRPPTLPYLPNVTARHEPQPTGGDFVERLTAHVSEPVRWSDTIDTLVALAPDACFLEVGPGGVVSNMLGRAWRQVRRARTDGPEGSDMRAAFDELLERLRDDD